MLRGLIARKSADLHGLRLRPAPLRAEVARRQDRLSELSARLTRAGDVAVQRQRDRLARADRLLETLSYKGTLARGYAVVRLEGAPMARSAALPRGAAVEVEFSDGRRAALLDPGGETPAPPPEAAPAESPSPKAKGKTAEKAPARPARKPARKPPSQGELF